MIPLSIASHHSPCLSQIVRSLGIDSSQMPDRSVVKEQVTAQQSSTLFDFTSDDSSTVPTTSQPTNQGTTTNHPSDDLDIFSTLETPSQPPQPQPSTNGGDMASLFGNMQMTVCSNACMHAVHIWS